MVLFLDENLAYLFSHRILTQGFALPDTATVPGNRLILIVEVESKHFFRIFRGGDRPGARRRHPPEVINLPRNDQGMRQFLSRVLFKFGGNSHVLGAFKHLRIDHVRNNGLILTSEIFIQEFDQRVPGDLFFMMDDVSSFNHDAFLDLWKTSV